MSYSKTCLIPGFIECNDCAMVLEHSMKGHEREKRETMALMQENEKLKSACRQSFGVDVKRGDGSGKRKGHQSTPPDCLGVPGERSILRWEPETRRVGEGTKTAPRSSATITNKCHIIFEKFGAWNS